MQGLRWGKNKTKKQKQRVKKGVGYVCQNLNFRQIWFSDRVFYVIIADADSWSLKSLHTLFDKYLDHMPVEFVWSELYKILSFNHFWQSVDAILEDVTVTDTIVWW